MSHSFASLLIFADAAAPVAPSPGQGLAQFIPFIFLFIIAYFLLLRPQQLRAKQQAALVASLKTGDRVVTASGIYGFIANVSDKTITVKIAEGVKVEMDRSSVTGVLNRNGDSKAASEPAAAKSAR